MQFAHNGYYKGSTPLGLKSLFILLISTFILIKFYLYSKVNISLTYYVSKSILHDKSLFVLNKSNSR